MEETLELLKRRTAPILDLQTARNTERDKLLWKHRVLEREIEHNLLRRRQPEKSRGTDIRTFSAIKL